MAQRKGLGKGLDALIPTGKPGGGVGGGTQEVPVESIQRNPRQPRARPEAGESIADIYAEAKAMQPPGGKQGSKSGSGPRSDRPRSDNKPVAEGSSTPQMAQNAGQTEPSARKPRRPRGRSATPA